MCDFVAFAISKKHQGYHRTFNKDACSMMIKDTLQEMTRLANELTTFLAFFSLAIGSQKEGLKH